MNNAAMTPGDLERLSAFLNDVEKACNAHGMCFSGSGDCIIGVVTVAGGKIAVTYNSYIDGVEFMCRGE